MGFFTKDEAAPAAELAPLTQERLVAVFGARGWSYFLDSEGDLGGFWDGHTFYFLIGGRDEELLTVRGRWNRRVRASEMDRVVEILEGFNRDNLWPKGYAFVDEKDGVVVVIGDHPVDYEPGVTDDQLFAHVRCATATTMQLFDHLDQHYPEVAGLDPAAVHDGPTPG